MFLSILNNPMSKTKSFVTTIFCLFVYVVTWAQTPTANFTSDVQQGCTPIIVNFTDQSTGNPTSWYWEFGNGVTSTKRHPSTSYFKPGQYNITLTVKNASGSNKVTKSSFIVAYQNPTVKFTTDRNTGCFPTNISFTDASTASAGTSNVNWFWDFGDGTQSTEQNPVKAYREVGEFNVTLKVTSDKGCTQLAVKPNLIKISPGVTVGFSNTQPTICSSPATVNFTNTSTGPGTLNYMWQFGNGDSATTKSPGYTYNDTGAYSVKLIVRSSVGCADSITKENAVIVGGKLTDFTIPNVVCANTPAILMNTSNPEAISSIWKASNGHTSTLKNDSLVFTNAGEYSIQLINKYSNCTDSVTKQITVIEQPKVNFSSPQPYSCSFPFTASFQNESAGAVSYLWDFGDSTTSTLENPSHTYNSFGAFTVKLISFNANGCSDTLIKNKFINIDTPVVRFSKLPVAGCVPYTIKPVAVITAVDPVSSYLWNFGNGVTSTDEKPTYVYTERGTYNVTLTITTSTGCSKTYTLEKAVTVGTKPIPNFTAKPLDVCATSSIQFTDASTPVDEVNRWIWAFGDGGISTARNPSYQYSDTGYFNVRLIVFNNGCPDTLTRTKYVHIKAPIAKFDYKPDCINKLQYTFTDKSIGAKTWLWTFGDGTTSNQKNPSLHTFPNYGTYKVSLTVSNDTCSFTVARTINISNEKPDFTTSVREACKPASISFKASVPDNGAAQNYTWRFGNGVSSTTVANGTSYSYNKTGYYTISLIVKDTFGCSDSIVKDNYIRINGPQAAFSGIKTAGCQGMVASFEDKSVTDGVNNIVRWAWNFGDGKAETFTSAPFQHQYDTMGKFTVSLRVYDAAGCSDLVKKDSIVNISIIKAEWTSVKESCPKANIIFTNKTSTSAYTSVWNFDNGKTSTSKSPTFAFADTGVYNVKLTVKDAVGCIDSLIQPVKVGNPVASFTANNFVTYCIPYQAKFTNTSTYANSWSWDLGSGGTSRQQNPVNYYTSRGTYNVKLVVTSPGGCKDSVTKQVKVLGSGDAAMSYNPLSGCIPLKVNLDAFDKINGHFIWDLGDGNLIDTNSNNIGYSYTSAGVYVPRVILIEPGGCIVPLDGIDSIRTYGITAGFQVNSNFFCDTGRLNINNLTTSNTPITSYSWDFGDGTKSKAENPTHVYTKPGTYLVSLAVQNDKNCKDTVISNPIRLALNPIISVTPDSVICMNNRIQHNGYALGGDTTELKWRWLLPGGRTEPVQNPNIIQYTQAGNFVLTAIALNKAGCADTAVSKVLVNPLPMIDMPSTLTMMLSVPVTIPATYSSNVVSYSWSPAIGLNCVNCPQPTANPKYGAKYTVSFIDSNGCRNTGAIQLVVACFNTNIFLPNTFSPNSDGKNDIFYIRGTGIRLIKTLRVFNRWGEVVFENKNFAMNDATTGWDGTYKGLKALPDVYVYQVEAMCDNGEILTYNGNVALIQ